MSLSQFHCTSRLYLDMHGLIFETSICYWQDQPGRPPVPPPTGGPARAGLGGVAQPRGGRGGRGPAPGCVQPAASARASVPVVPPGARAAAVGHLCLALYPSRKDVISGGCPAPSRSCFGRVARSGERQRKGFEKTSFRSGLRAPAGVGAVLHRRRSRPARGARAVRGRAPG